jgi:hypothetical protein
MTAKMKSRKDLHNEIGRLEERLDEDKREIKEDLRFVSIVLAILPPAFRFVKQKAKGRYTVDDVLRGVISHRMGKAKPETLLDKIMAWLPWKRPG